MLGFFSYHSIKLSSTRKCLKSLENRFRMVCQICLKINLTSPSTLLFSSLAVYFIPEIVNFEHQSEPSNSHFYVWALSVRRSSSISQLSIFHTKASKKSVPEWRNAFLLILNYYIIVAKQTLSWLSIKKVLRRKQIFDMDESPGSHIPANHSLIWKRFSYSL